MRRFALSIMIVLSAYVSNAQNILPLQPNGPIPVFYRCASHTLVDQQIAQRKANGDPPTEMEQEFMREMSYYSQQRFFSGFVLYNDSLSNYVQKVGDEVLKNDSVTRSQLHFYVYKSADPNAYTSATGTILITVGLLAQLENEAQLAFILCHEITHYRNEHMLKGYLNREELKNKDNTPYYLLQSSALSYNQEQELEADMQGFQLFMQSSYSKKEALRSFDVLEYANFPFDDVPFDTTFFNMDYIKIPAGYYEKNVDPIYTDDNYNDVGSTHPNVRKRRMALMTVLDTVKNKDGKLFVVSKNEFLSTRELSRYEICRLYLEDRDYPNAIYASYMMLQKHPDDIYFKKIIGRSLYNLAAYEQSGKSTYNPYDWWGGLFGESYGGKYSALLRAGYYGIPDTKDYPGEQQQLYSLFHAMDPDELTCLALAYNWKIHRADMGDSLQLTLCDSLFSMLVNNQNLHYSYFSKITPEEAKGQLKQDSLDRAQETGETGDSKFSRLDKFKLSSEKEKFTKFAFVELLKDSDFVHRFEYYTDHRRALVDYVDPDSYDTPSKKEQKKEDADEKLYGYGINRVIVAGPDFEEYHQKDRDDDPEQDFTLSENGQTNMTNVINTAATDNGVQAVVLNPFTMDSVNGDQFDDLAMLNEWFYEKLEHGDNNYAWTVNNQAQADSISKKYNTRYVMFTAVETNYYKRIQHPFWYGVSCLAIVPAVRAFIPRNKYYYDVALLDLKTGEVIYVDHQAETKGKEKEVTANYYNKLFAKMVKPKKPVEKKKTSEEAEKERGM
ncbi:MAG: M48 family metalloprotease [Bacteroidetes bacterium]|nr:M48 family metalloprotease [Bacteroidota bacterium]